MDTSALYSDIVLPSASWYEKDDLNSTDMHSFIHPLSAAVPPSWESKSDWQIFRAIAKNFSELAQKHFPERVKDIVATALAHDTPAEIAQPEIKDWMCGETAAVPGKTMPALTIVEQELGHDLVRTAQIEQLDVGKVEQGGVAVGVGEGGLDACTGKRPVTLWP